MTGATAAIERPRSLASMAKSSEGLDKVEINKREPRRIATALRIIKTRLIQYLSQRFIKPLGSI